MLRWKTLILTPICILLLTNIVQSQQNKMSIGPKFHFETSYDTAGLKGKDISNGTVVPFYKTYPNAKITKLPVSTFSGLTVESAIAKRKSVRAFTNKAITLDQLSRLLISANGITQKASGFERRSVPSAGALYPIELYVVVSNVQNLENGLYHFQVKDSSLELIKTGNFDSTVNKASFEQEAVGSSPVTLILTARFDRTTKKYADRGYRYIYMEVGCITQNIYLETTSLGLGTVAIGAFCDDLANDFIGIDSMKEATMLIMPIGYPNE